MGKIPATWLEVGGQRVQAREHHLGTDAPEMGCLSGRRQFNPFPSLGAGVCFGETCWDQSRSPLGQAPRCFCAFALQKDLTAQLRVAFCGGGLMAKSALLLPAPAGRSRQGRWTVLAAGSFHPDGCLTQPMNGMSRIGRAGSSLGIRSELVPLQLTPSPSERSLVTHIPSGSPQGCPLRFGITQMPGLLPPPLEALSQA